MKSVQELAVMLRSKDGAEREQTRNNLVTIGKQSVPTLCGLLSDPDQQIRWEACKALGTIMDPDSIEALVGSLRDDNMDVRWLAAEALIAFGKDTVAPLLSALETHFESAFLRDGAYRILHELEGRQNLEKSILNVLDRLRSSEPHSAVAVAAYEALQALR